MIVSDLCSLYALLRQSWRLTAHLANQLGSQGKDELTTDSLLSDVRIIQQRSVFQVGMPKFLTNMQAACDGYGDYLRKSEEKRLKTGETSSSRFYSFSSDDKYFTSDDKALSSEEKQTDS